MSSDATIRVLAFGSAAAALGWERRDAPFSPGMRVRDVQAWLEGLCPRLAQARGRVRFAVNQAFTAPDTEVRAGDEIAVIPPVSGG